MAQEGFKRKLTAILSADAVEYSRLMGEDEEATVRILTAYREVLSTLIQQHNGHVLDSPGDNLLAEFVSVVDAVQCAVAVQKEIKARNDELPENRRMQFRIGINLGDVIQEEGRIYGDGVNIAARLEGLAEPGGICISKTAFDHIETKLPYGYEFLGDQTVKNIPKPVGAYRVLMEPRVTVAKKPKEKKSVPMWRTPILVVAIAVLMLAVAAGIWQFYMQRPVAEPASVEKMAYPLPDKPSIAVLPFVNMSEDPKQEYFCDGLTEEIITALSNVPKLLIIAHNSVFSYKSKPVKVNQVAEELGVRYVLEGSIRKAENEIRITAQLIDALSGHPLWAERYDRNLSEIFAVQDDITKNIITALQVKLTEGEQVRAAAKGTNNLEAYIKYLQAIDKISQFNIESNALGKQLAQEAITLDPEYAMAYIALHRSHLMDVWLGTSKSPKQSIAKAMELTQKAIELDETYAEAHGHLGFLYSMIGQHDKAVAKGEQAVALNPNSAYAHMILGHTLRFAGRHQEAIPEYKKAIRLNPIPPTNYLFGLGLAYAWTGQYEEAIKWCEKAVHNDPNSFMAHLMMIVVYSLSGRDEGARAEAAEALRINPNFSVEEFERAVKIKNKMEKERFIGTLRKAGLK
jgi:adenylate cyclase